MWALLPKPPHWNQSLSLALADWLLPLFPFIQHIQYHFLEHTFSYGMSYALAKQLPNHYPSDTMGGFFYSQGVYEGYAKPSRLIPAKGVEVCTDFPLEKLVTSFNVGRLESIYKVTLQTCNIYGSGLTNINSGMLLCLIDENGDSILQRLPVTSTKDHPTESGKKLVSDVLNFERGSVDEFIFKGPMLGKIQALWISPESGQWRLGGASLGVISRSLIREEYTKEDIEHVGLKYDFVTDDVLLGEGSDTSMIELRPSRIMEISGDSFASLSKDLSKSVLLETNSVSKEESMKEYADLKFSLLIYDAMLILAGSAIASFSVGENAAFSFLTGGIGGFAYLLLLQRSVDGLPAPTPTAANRAGNVDQVFERFKVPVSSLVVALALAFAVSITAVKLGSGDGAVMLTPKDLVFGMMGFLACKVAVVLAALKPLRMA
ncbi:hypothetical protein RJ639_012158 [Escallonia herrerae]|uniref:DUF7755 domain-containing protein n=1 Tax=Escallonia herrerae TaxID=1293975 RepID=A0AA88VLS4_9ASTE|nr:hypothetical protein RJ639_012158 [Escallonia herrerae]